MNMEDIGNMIADIDMTPRSQMFTWEEWTWKMLIWRSQMSTSTNHKKGDQHSESFFMCFCSFLNIVDHMCRWPIGYQAKAPTSSGLRAQTLSGQSTNMETWWYFILHWSHPWSSTMSSQCSPKSRFAWHALSVRQSCAHQHKNHRLACWNADQRCNCIMYLTMLLNTKSEFEDWKIEPLQPGVLDPAYIYIYTCNQGFVQPTPLV